MIVLKLDQLIPQFHSKNRGLGHRIFVDNFRDSDPSNYKTRYFRLIFGFVNSNNTDLRLKIRIV